VSRSVIALALTVIACVTACSGKYRRPLTADKINATPEMVERGNYIVNQIGACGACHTSRDGSTLKDFVANGERADRFLAGGMFIKVEGFGEMWLPNITPDVETGIGGWSDDELMRAIRDGVDRKGRLMFPMMPFTSYHYMSDDDVKSVIAYLRTVPPVKLDKPRQENDFGFFMNFLLARGVAHHMPTTKVPQPDKTDKVKYGEYVMHLGHCWECHSTDGKGVIENGQENFMAGFDEADPALEKAVGKVYFRNLTPDPETGLGKYSADQIKAAIRNGTRLDGKRMAPPMSMMIPHYSGMSDEDLDALVAFLKALPPQKHKIPERELLPEWKQKLGD